MSYEFDIATAVVEESPGHFSARLHPGWGVWDTVNGGYVAAVATSAMAAASGKEHPVAIAAHFIRPARIGPVAIETSLIWAGRTFTRVTATITQDGRPVLAVLGTFGPVSHVETPDLLPAVTDLPPPEDCVEPDRSGFENATVAERIETLMAPEDAALFEGRPSGKPRITAHVRFRDGRPIDPLALVFLADAMPPPIFNLTTTLQWVPTISLNVQVRQQPNPGWLRIRTTSPPNNYNRVTEEVVIHDTSGRLVATASQLALLAAR